MCPACQCCIFTVAIWKNCCGLFWQIFHTFTTPGLHSPTKSLKDPKGTGPFPDLTTAQKMSCHAKHVLWTLFLPLVRPLVTSWVVIQGTESNSDLNILRLYTQWLKCLKLVYMCVIYFQIFVFMIFVERTTYGHLQQNIFLCIKTQNLRFCIHIVLIVGEQNPSYHMLDHYVLHLPATHAISLLSAT